MKPKIWVTLGVTAVAILIFAGSHVVAQSGERVFVARLDGFHETPAISTNATGAFRATLNAAGSELSYEFQFSGLEGGNSLFAHVHIGQTSVNGGVMFFLCGGGKPPCPNVQGTVTGTVNASNVIGPSTQGITPGEFDEVIR